MSNALGTSVGSKALTVRQAIVVGAICEFLGSLVGGEVAATISGGILQMDVFAEMGQAGVDLYAHCMFVTMCGAFAWLAVATYYGLPVSTTHSLVGSLVGVGCVAMSVDGVNWGSVGRIGACVCVCVGQAARCMLNGGQGAARAPLHSHTTRGCTALSHTHALTPSIVRAWLPACPPPPQ